MSQRNADLSHEAESATKLLQGKIVAIVWQHRKEEIGIEFTDGTRLFVDCSFDGIELSITNDLSDES